MSCALERGRHRKVLIQFVIFFNFANMLINQLHLTFILYFSLFNNYPEGFINLRLTGISIKRLTEGGILFPLGLRNYWTDLQNAKGDQ